MSTILISCALPVLGFFQIVDVFFWSLLILAVLFAAWILLMAGQRVHGWYTDKHYKVIKIKDS